MMLEVRCCRDASKLLGYMDSPYLQRKGDRLRKIPGFIEAGRDRG